MTGLETVGGRIRYARDQQGLSLDRLSQRAGVSKSFLWEVENDRSGISGERLLKVANVLGASLDYLLRGQTTPGMETPKSVEIPLELGQLAAERHLSYNITIALLEIEHSLVARRTGPGRRRLSREEWEDLYNAVAPFLEDGS